jgi:diguanylate cyclase (GGDEF)-like protein
MNKKNKNAGPDISREIHDLKEIIEVAQQITTGLDIDFIIKSAVFSIVSKFNPECTGFIMQRDMDDLSPEYYLYRGNKRIDETLDFDSIEELSSFFIDKEFNQITFDQFSELFPDKNIIQNLARYKPAFVIPIKSYKGISGLFLMGKRADYSSYSSDDIQYCVQVLNFASIAIENANLYREATVDRMTKLFTHHQFQKRLEEEIQKGQRYGTPFSLLMFDIDHFKDFNDKYGHLQGDIIIKEMSKLLCSSIRTIDFPARYGGEEFIVILPEITLPEAVMAAERLRKLVEKHEFPGDDTTYSAQISLGVVEFNKNHVVYNNNIIEAVDQALYFSKQNGRNRTSISHYNDAPETVDR